MGRPGWIDLLRTGGRCSSWVGIVIWAGYKGDASLLLQNVFLYLMLGILFLLVWIRVLF